ncbi:MAG: peptide chain release factor 1 [Candidatus Wildermuthbacteria bacterium]|nr:peptide chain release factor 1 [Candidatus Wildermuthbacteria bacterium]
MIDLAKIKQEYDALTKELTNPDLISNWEKFQDISKRRSSLEKIIKKAEELEELKKKIEENKQILSSQEDPELSSLAEEELLAIEEQAKKTEKDIEALVKKREADTPDALIIEIRPGTGGEEASLFARNLLDMYIKYAQAKAWKEEVLNLNETDLGGIKEASLEVSGEDAFEKLQYEAGVHRVQRIPETEKAGRIHTSTASVAVLPKPKRTELHISPNDLKLEFFNSSGPGGQNVNKRKTAVRLIFIPTNLVIEVQNSRTQQKNKEYAMALLEAKLAEQKREKEEKEMSGQRKSQIGWAKRAEKIRTYNFPQDRITDHRIEKSWHGIEKIMEGNLDPVSDALLEYQRSKLK